MSTGKHPEDPAEGARDTVERELQRQEPERDAEGQSETSHKGGSNDGASSAGPRVVSGEESGDATFPLDQDEGKAE